MVHLKASIDIFARPEEVFRLVADVERRTRLDPHVAVLGVAQLTHGPLNPGTEFHHRVVIGGHIADYRSRCVAYEPGRLMEMVSDSSPPFTTRVQVAPNCDGACLIHEEFFELPELCMPLPRAGGWFGKVLTRMFGDAEYLRQGAEALAQEEAQMEALLQQRLNKWLQAIKRHLEKSATRLVA
jgi:hypothetical protein